jgi:hypothetical protein
LAGSEQSAGDLLRIRNLVNLWYVKEDFWKGAPELVDAINDDIGISLQRLRDRGVSEPRLIEAYITEHRGAQFITSQLLSSRAYVDVALPFADHDLLRLVTQLPSSIKVHNALNKRMLSRHAPKLLRFPTGATLVRASMPTLIQESSRLTRHVIEDLRWKLHFKTHGFFDHPHFDWFSWEFLRDGRALAAIADDLRCSFWHKDAIRKRIETLKREQGMDPLSRASYLSRSLLKMYTVDMMLR